MRRLKFPIAHPYHHSHEDVMDFWATLEQLRPLGEPGYIEGDSSRTAGLRELFWGFETHEGLRFQVQWFEGADSCRVTADPPDPAATVSALRTLGLEGLRFDLRTHDLVKELPIGQTHGLAWVFTPEGTHPPPALFSRKPLADQWLARTRASGRLQAYPLDASRYEFERRFLFPEELAPASPLEAQRYIGTIGEWYEYRGGQQVERWNHWQVWRQEANGTRFMLAEFEQRSEAEAEKERLERQSRRPLTYSVLQGERPTGGEAPDPRTESAPRTSGPGEVHRTVLAFTPEGNHQPTGVFSSKPLADKWLAKARGSGVLQVHVVDGTETQQGTDTSGEWYEYLEGRQFEVGTCWRLWRQDDNGTRFVMAEFDKRSVALAEMEKMERRGHKQTYWVAQREASDGGS